MKYRFTLETKSFLLTGSGEGGVLIDADVVFHPTGFPYIPAKRIKGLLRESLEEVLEIFGKGAEDIQIVLDTLFGESGRPTYEGKLMFRNLYVKDWGEITKVLKFGSGIGAFHPDYIKSYYTTEIQQNALAEDGIAKKRSLRNYRVIKPEFRFEALFDVTSTLTGQEWDWLQKAVRNLRYAGTRRNRGFGKIDCRIDKVIDEQAPVDHTLIHIENIAKIEVDITIVAPVILAKQLGEQNTVFTLDHITGNHLRGLLANAYIRKKGLIRAEAHIDKIFFELFLSGKVQFGSLTFNNGKSIPSHIHSFKHDKEKDPVSIFSTEPDEITKPLTGRGKIESGVVYTDGYDPVTTFNFHNSREDRSAGRNKAKDETGGIFYYESLNEGQTFRGEITGEAHLLKQLNEVFDPIFTARLGRSKSVQYGEVSVSFTPCEKVSSVSGQTHPERRYVLTLESPLVLLNENGVPSTDKYALENVLSDSFTILNAAASITTIEQFNATWQSKSGKYAAYKEGSSFLLELKSELTRAEPITFLGEWNEQGFGKVRLESFDKGLRYTRDQSNGEIDENPDGGEGVGVAILDSLKESYLQEQGKIEIKTYAIEDASRFKRKLNNHQIGRLERLFESSSNPGQIDKWVEEAIDKPAGEVLKKAGLIDDNSRFRLKQREIKEFDLQRIYWISLLRTLRKNNKAHEQKQR